MPLTDRILNDLDGRPVEMAAAETSGLAVAAMVFAVLLACIPVIGPIASLIFAARARVDVRRSEGYLRGAELARAAEIVSVSFLLVHLVTVAVGIGILLKLS